MTIYTRLIAVHESVQVDCPVEEAFGLFTTHMGKWWPLDKASYGGNRAKDIFLEPQVGGVLLRAIRRRRRASGRHRRRLRAAVAYHVHLDDRRLGW
jgi:hypothetical protein